MNTISRKKAVAAAVLAAATIGLPTTSMADPVSSNYRYEDCKRSDTEAQVVGGLIGALAGGIAGSEIAGSGDRTEGAVIGAALGAGVGATIADKDCGERRYRDGYRTTYTTRPTYGNTYRTGHNTYYGGSRTPYYGNTYGNRSYGNTSYGGNYGYTRRSNPPYGRATGNPHVRRWGFTPQSHVCRSGETRKQHLKWQIDELRRERDYLERKRRYAGYDRGIDRRMWEIGEELRYLKDELKYVKRYGDNHNHRHNQHNTYYYKTKKGH